MTRARHWAILLLAAGCVLALASGLAACGGSGDGVTLGGTPRRVTGLDLRARQLTGTIPAALADLNLTDLFLSENDLTGCLPRELTQVTRNDLDQLDLETCELRLRSLPYGAPTTTGSVTDAGDYAFLSDPDDLTTLVTTYEGLRDGSTTGLVLHQNDSSGASQAAFYALVRAGDLVEWHHSDSCFVRYTVTEVKDDPAGSPPRKLLAVAWMTYAFTGCSGAISSTATASVQWGPLPALGGTSLTVPVIHGIYQLVPEDWTGTTEAGQVYHPPGVPPGPYYGGPLTHTEDLTAARTHTYWREPALPADWTFAFAVTGGYETSPIGYCAAYSNARGFGAVTICADYATDRRFSKDASWSWRGDVDDLTEGHQGVYETRVIAGRPAQVTYSPPGPKLDGGAGIDVWIYDPATATQYQVIGWDSSLRGANVDAVIAIARSLFEPPNAP